MNKIIISAIALFAITSAASAADICKAYDASQWMSKEDITKKVTEMGYEIKKLDKEDGCWEVKGMKDGKQVEAYFDPTTAELVKSK